MLGYGLLKGLILGLKTLFHTFPSLTSLSSSTTWWRMDASTSEASSSQVQVQ